MAQARRPGSSQLNPIFALNNGLDDILIILKDVNRESSTTLKDNPGRYSTLRFENILSTIRVGANDAGSFEKYMERLPSPGTMLTSKDYLVAHNLRESLSGSFSLFDSRVQRFIEEYRDLISFVEKNQRKRPAGKETVKQRTAKDSFTAISQIADAALRSEIEPLGDFDLAEMFKAGPEKSNLVTMEEVLRRPVLPPIEEELELDPVNVFDFDRIIADLDESLKGRSAQATPRITKLSDVVPTGQIQAEVGDDIFPQAHRRSDGILDAETHLRDHMIVPEGFPADAPPGLPQAERDDVLPCIPEAQRRSADTPAQITPPLGEIPRFVLEQATGSRELLEVEIRKRMEELEAQGAAQTEMSKGLRRKKTSQPVGLLKKDLFRTSLQLPSSRVNKIMLRGSDVNPQKLKWMTPKPDPYSEENLLKEAGGYQYKYWKKYRADMEDVDEIDMVVQCIQGEVIEVTGRTPLRAESRLRSSIEGQTPKGHPSPSPHLPVDLTNPELQLAEGAGQQHSPLLPVPLPIHPERSSDHHTPLLPVPPLPRQEADESEDRLALLPLVPQTQTGYVHPPVPQLLEDTGFGREVMDFLAPLGVQMELEQPQPHSPLHPVPRPRTQSTQRDADMGRRMEVEQVIVSIPVEVELSEATRAQNALERREEQRNQVVGKMRGVFVQDPSAVLAFTDLCPKTSTKLQAAQTFCILIELSGEREVILSQESPDPQHIYIKSNKTYKSTTETCSDSTFG